MPAVLRHLEKLADAGLVRIDRAERGGRSLPLYTTNAPRLYTLLEDLRQLCIASANAGDPSDATGTLGQAQGSDDVTGPRLVLVHGLYEGRAYALAKAQGERPWTIGRRRGSAVTLDYDPYVSLDNAVVARRAGQWVLTDLAESKNGTSINWRRLPKAGSQALRAGDVIGVGRSLLSFVPE
jgi:hypothetical protein